MLFLTIMKSLLIFLYSFFCAINIYAQAEPVSFQFTRNGKLEDIFIYDLKEDKHGNIWLAGQKGLYRYNGQSFKKYTNSKRKGLSFFNLSLDEHDNIWCSNINGDVFQVEQDSLRFRYSISEEFNLPNRMYLVYSFNKQLYVYGGGIFGRINEQNEIKEQYLDEFETTSTLHLKDTLFWGGAKHGSINNYKIYYVTKDQLKPKLYNEIHCQYPGTIIGNLYHYKNKLHVIFRHQENSIYSVTRKAVELLPENIKFNDKIVSINSMNDSINWVSTYKGAHLITSNNQQIKSSIFEDIPVAKLMKDQCGNLWVGTLGRGLAVLPNNQLQTIPFSSKYGQIKTGCVLNESQLVFGTDQGYLLFYNTNKQFITTTKYVKNIQQIRQIFYDQNQEFLYLFSDSKNGLIYDLKTERLFSKKEFIFRSVKSFTQVSEDQLFISGYFEQVLFDLKKNKRIHREFPRGRTYASHYSSKSNCLYISYLDGIKKVNKNNQVTPIQISKQNDSSLVASHFTELENGDIYVGTFQDGLFKVEGDQVTQQFSKKNGLLSNQITGLTHHGNVLWVATEKSIQRIDLATNEISVISYLDGVESFKITSLISLGQQIVFTTNLGLFTFNEETIFKPFCHRTPYLTSVSIAGEQMPIQKKYIIKASQNNIQVKFNTNGFQYEKTYRYQYKLEGFHKTWQPVSSGVQEVQFNSLPQGHYRFLLKSINQEQEAMIEPLEFVVKEYVYKQWWFILIIGFSLLSIIIAYYTNLMKRQKIEQQIILEQHRYETEKVALKLENLRSQMNPHFIFNALNSIQDYILNNQKNLAGDYLGKFAHLIRLYLDQTRKKTISLEEEMDTLNRYLELEKLRFEDLLEYSITHQEIETSTEMIPTMLIQPYVENAIKHGFLHKKNRGILTIHFSIDANKEFLYCEIRDNGIGRKKAKQIQQKQRRYQPFSTKAITDRVQLLNHQLSQRKKITVQINDLYQNEQASGTEVILIIPRNTNELIKN